MKTTVNKISTKKNDMYEHKCAHSSCDKIGEFKAPVSRESINEYIYFCLDHIREYNKKKSTDLCESMLSKFFLDTKM